jgi:TonB family protein
VDAVSPILVERAREPQGLRNMWILSLVVHGVATTMLLMMPTPSLEDDSLKNAMTISLGGAPGVRNGGMTNVSGRTAEASPNPEKAPLAPPASKPPEMVLPTKKEPLKPAPAKAPVDTKARPVPKALEATQGDARIDTGARGAGFGLTTGGGAGATGYLDVANFCCPEYLSTMIQLIQRNWNAKQNVAGITRIKYTIQRDGRLTDIQLEQSSGYFALDQTAQRALILTRQLPPLPAQFPESTLTVHLNFSYER